MREDLRNDESLNSDSHPRDFRKSLGCDADDVEAALVKLQPRRSSVNRDRLLFLAGKAAGAAERSPVPRTRRWTWPLATFASVAAMLVFAVLFGIERGRGPAVRTIVNSRPGPAAVLTTLPGVKPRENVARAKPEPTVAVEEFSDTATVQSRMVRSRHPALMTDPDLLPDSLPPGGQGAANRLAVGDTRRVMSDEFATPRAKTPSSGFPSLLNPFRFGGGGL